MTVRDIVLARRAAAAAYRHGHATAAEAIALMQPGQGSSS